MDGITKSHKSESEDVGNEPEAEMTEDPKPLLSWESPSFIYKDKNPTWFLISRLVILALIGFFIWTQDWFSVVITVVVSAVLYWYITHVRPSDIDYSISDMGITAGKNFYPFSDIHSYWMVYNDKIKTLNIAFIKKYLPTLVIDIGEMSPLKIKEFLSNHIPEQEKRGESVIDQIIRRIGL